ncbi:putative transport protein [Anaeromyces robustus]|uniref:Putative transport protein n=1 Tax=Anaeromyces robustus TaxID=1754192 RepID=A0A1Y1WYT0_9FUNG|nr:putative transport protein [Anaeromyces robustus]|eukprot:ORX78508.1 putative transport protein [Anaeromyces robustus]
MNIPIGVIVNVLSVAIGGIIGTLSGNYMSSEFKEKITMIFACCSFGMGITAIVLMQNMPAVILSLILGTIIGITIKLGYIINKGGEFMQKSVSKFIKMKNTHLTEKEFMNSLVTIIVLFCASGTGIYGSIVSGMTGDHSILLSKSILDLFTAAIFACNLGSVISLISLPQMIIFTILFYCATFIYPLTTEHIINDFKACGGLVLFATGFRMLKLTMFPVADMIPSMIIVMPISYLWETYVAPYIS